jgi:hypothetical protein
LPGGSDAQQALWHGQVDPCLAGRGQDAALFAARLKERGVGVVVED